MLLMYSSAIIIVFVRTPKVERARSGQSRAAPTAAHLVARFRHASGRKESRTALSLALSLSLSLSLLSRSLLCKQTINLLRFLLFALGGKLSYVVVAAVSLLLHADRPRVSRAAQRRGGCRRREGEEASFVFAGIRYHKGNWSRPSLRPGCVCLDDFMCST